jgi:hypothetical protein
MVLADQGLELFFIDHRAIASRCRRTSVLPWRKENFVGGLVSVVEKNR